MDDERDVYLFLFDTQQKADYWMLQTAGKFHTDLIKLNRARSRLEFEDSIYYFISKNRVSAAWSRNAITYSAEDLYIILGIF